MTKSAWYFVISKTAWCCLSCVALNQWNYLASQLHWNFEITFFSALLSLYGHCNLQTDTVIYRLNTGYVLFIYSRGITRMQFYLLKRNTHEKLTTGCIWVPELPRRNKNNVQKCSHLGELVYLQKSPWTVFAQKKAHLPWELGWQITISKPSTFSLRLSILSIIVFLILCSISYAILLW